MASAPKAVPAANTEDEARAPKKSKNKLFLVVIMLLMLGGGSAGGWYFSSHKSHGNADGSTENSEVEKPPVFVNLEPFTVNLQPENGDQFLQATITIQAVDQNQVDAIKLYMPQVRNRLLLLLSSKRASEISTMEGKKKLADEVTAQLKLPFSQQGSQQGISNVFFTSFVIQ